MKTTLLTLLLLLFSLSLNAKIIYIEPIRDAQYVSIYNNIIIGFNEDLRVQDLSGKITVKGSLSGIHAGEIIITSDKRKLLFKPYQPFAFNEIVEVTLNRVTTLNSSDKLIYTFRTQIIRPDFDYSTINEEADNSTANKISVNDNLLSPPPLTVTISNNPTPGVIYLTSSRNTPTSPYIMQANNDGSLFYFRELPSNPNDYKKQPNGLMTYFDVVRKKYYAEDSQHNTVDSFYTGNGYVTDQHELKLLPNGHALMMSYDPEIVDMSVIVQGGDPMATVMGLIIQETDENKNVVFQWRSWDHYNIIDATHTILTSATVDYAHGNAIEPDFDGNILISARHLSEITKIDRNTGNMIWRLGGVNNQFTFPNDSIEISYQHDIRRLANRHITMFDNGNFHSTQFSRAIEYSLDEVNKVATLVWQYRNNPDIYGNAKGSVQRLSTGNTLICWGAATTTVTEVTPAGAIALEMSFPINFSTYRAYKEEPGISVNVKLALEGFYNVSGNNLNMKDTVRAYLRNITAPYSIVDSAKSLVDTTSFLGIYRYYYVPTGTYYISTKHRNGLETWSKTGGTLLTANVINNYDFTAAAANSYGNNAVLKGSKYCIYSGDVNQDKNIDLTDVITIYNNAIAFVTGYNNTDVNGDNISDLTDLIITYNNSVGFISVVKP